MKQHRLVVFAILGLAVALIGVVGNREGGVETVELPLLVGFSVTAGLVVAAVVIDTLWHAAKGQGQACRICGHVRPMSSFRIYRSCPNCGR